MTYPKLNGKGFTLLEMMVVVAIISLMSVLVMGNYNSQKKAKEMQFSAQKIADSIRKAQNYSINIKKLEGYNVSGGYGIHFIAGNSFTIFLDDSVDRNKTYGVEDHDVETVELPSGVNIESLNGGAVVGAADLVFEPPYGNVHMSFDGTLQTSTPSLSLSIEIKRSGESCPEFCKTVSINSQGQIN